ncbi:MAG: LacI family DNA-binding transcriptional regulator [Solirubrobacteraceae bacterium]
MRDVAALAGVSLKTVSRVINDEPGVADATTRRVGEAIAELGFRRNDLARSLRQGRTSSTLGLVIEDVANPFYSAIAQAVEAVARERDFMLITASCEEDPQRERELVEALLRRRVDALLLVPASHDHGYLEAARSEGTPVVFVDRPPVGLEADVVLLDNVGGARSAVEHLLAHGHERIAMVADPGDLSTASERLAGYREALVAAGIPVRDELVRTGTHDAQQAEAAVRELLALPPERRPTALFAGNNRNTVGALHALRGAEREVALVGFDDLELAELLAVPTTVVRHDSKQLGAQAAEIAFARLGGSENPPRRVVVPTELVIRGSGEVPPP